MPDQLAMRARRNRSFASANRSRLTLASALALCLACARGTGGTGTDLGDAGPVQQSPDNIKAGRDAEPPERSDDSGASGGTMKADASLSPTPNVDAAANGDGSGNGGGNPTGDTDSGSITSDADAPRAAYCAGKGPPVLVDDGTDGGVVETCTGTIARKVFGHAVCSCTDVDLPGYLETRSFSSATNPAQVAWGAPVGINRDYRSYGYTDVGGTMSVAGPGDLAVGGYAKIGGDLLAQGPVVSQGYIDVARDANFASDVRLAGLLTVGRDLVQSPNKTKPQIAIVGGQSSNGAVSIAPPCDCAPSNILDIGSIVTTGRTDNDNAVVGLDPAVLSNVVEIGKSVSLPCGRFLLNSIRVLGSASIHLSGRTAIYVDGDIDLVGALTVEMDPGAELDLFVRGKLLGVGYGSFGDRARPKASRVYVATHEDIVLTGASAFVGNLYAPTATVRSDGDVELFGSLFAKAIHLNGSLRVRYDREILNVDEDCPDPESPPSCNDTCTSACGHQACVEGMCIACRSDADCCGPLVCRSDGACGPLER